MSFAAEPGRRRATLQSAAAALMLVAGLAAVLAHGGGLSWRQRSAVLTGTNHSGGGLSSAEQCSAWVATHQLGSGCLAELDAGVKTVPCCGGTGYACKPCPPPKLQALCCVSPRHTLLLADPSCSTASGTAIHGCMPLSSKDVLSGRWVNASTVPDPAPGVPPLLFQPGRQGRHWPPLGAGEVLAQLWGVGIDRVVVSGDSTVRHLFNRLVSILRQQKMVIDGGGIAHAHYMLQAWQPVSAAAGSGVDTSSSSEHEGGSGWATDELWVSPAANFDKDEWDEGLMADGLEELMRRSFSSGDGGSSASSGGSGNVGHGLTLDFVIGAKAAWQQPHVRQYFGAEGGDGGTWRQRTLLLLSLCVWEQSQVFRSGWLEFVEEMRAQVGQVVLLTCPTDRIRRPQHAKGRKRVAERNKRLREMVSEGLGGSASAGTDAKPSSSDGEPGSSSKKQLGAEGLGGGGTTQISRRRMSGGGGGEDTSSGTSSKGGGGPSPGRPLLLMDLDGLTQRLPPGSGLGVAPTDFHYQCMLSSSTTYNDTGPIQWSGGDGAPHPLYHTMRYDRLLVPPAGTCADPVNYAGWELLLAMLCPQPRA